MDSNFEHLRDFNYYKFSNNDNHTLCEYIWIDGTGENLRSKTKVTVHDFFCAIEGKYVSLQIWNGGPLMATTADSEIYLKPVFCTPDPFRGDPHLLVLCETYLKDKKTPARFNYRYLASQIMEQANPTKPQFGIEQEYLLSQRTGTTETWPLGWPKGGFPFPQGQYYCSIGEKRCFGRAVSEAHLRCCLNAGLKIAGVNAETCPSQWEFQIGVADGIEAGDHLWMARFILNKIGEEFGVDISYEPKPIQGNWAGGGGHVNFSNERTRAKGGYEYICKAMLPKLEKTHADLIKLYGASNQKRLTGENETSRLDLFTWGDGSRAVSARIPIDVKVEGRGYFEDRRPAANMDPYLVTAALVDVLSFGGKRIKELINIQQQYYL